MPVSACVLCSLLNVQLLLPFAYAVGEVRVLMCVPCGRDMICT